jgi:hypothetical protein
MAQSRKIENCYFAKPQFVKRELTPESFLCLGLLSHIRRFVIGVPLSAATSTRFRLFTAPFLV